MKFEIERDQLLKIKKENYELYQMIMSLKQDNSDGDYCQTLDKAKLAKECVEFCLSMYRLTNKYTTMYGWKERMEINESRAIEWLKYGDNSKYLFDEYHKSTYALCAYIDAKYQICIESKFKAIEEYNTIVQLGYLSIKKSGEDYEQKVMEVIQKIKNDLVSK